MYIFSRPKNQNYPTPEFKTILETIQDIKREINEFGQTTSDTIAYNRLIKRVDSLEQSIHRHSRQLDQLELALMTAASTKLTEKQRTILHWLTTRYEEDEVCEKLPTYKEVEEVAIIYGEYDAIIKVKTDNMKTLDNFITETLRALPNIFLTATMLIAKQYK